jgi:rfaE bifunctional protein nucleotidyltransferase chain/domain
MRTSEIKIVTRRDLQRVVNDYKERGKTVVLANGCFDVLHVGHVRYLQGAKEEGDVLIVAVNSDESVSALKGPGRPILDESARARLVAAVRGVDHVVIFSEPSVEALLEDLRPSAHAKGTDYTADTVPERATANRLGIRIAIVGDAKNHSTRGMLESLRKAPHG